MSMNEQGDMACKLQGRIGRQLCSWLFYCYFYCAMSVPSLCHQHRTCLHLPSRHPRHLKLLLAMPRLQPSTSVLIALLVLQCHCPGYPAQGSSRLQRLHIRVWTDRCV